MKKIVIACLFMSVLFGAALLLTAKHPKGRMLMSEYDYAHLNGLLFNAFGKDYGGRKSDAQLYKSKMPLANYDWLIQKDLWIAHGLGRKGSLNNSLAAFNSSLEAGLHYFEVDILIVDNKLVCAHSQREFPANSACNLESLISLAQKHNVWFILDVKSEFQRTYSLITTSLKKSKVGRRFIPQIYQFNQIKHLDLELFSGPLFTGYRRNQSGEFLLNTAKELLLPAITLPPNKLPKLNALEEIRVFTHNINSKTEHQTFESAGVSGFYIREPLFRELKISN